jgi:hypothetical protein
MVLPAFLRKLALTVHLTTSVGWIGAVGAFLVLALLGVRGGGDDVARAAFVMMDPLLMYVIVPVAFGALVTGIVSALGTHWGLFRHYWVVIKLVLTVIAVAVLLVQVKPIRELARVAAERSMVLPTGREIARPLVHSVGGLLVLLVVQVLGVYKPRGMTSYGERKERAGPSTGSG